MHTPITSSTTIRSGLGIFALGLISVAVLNACGGGDSVRAPAAAAAGPCDINAPAPTNFLTSASCSTPTAALAAGTVRYLIQGPSTSVEGTTTAFTQETTGAVGALTRIGTSSLAPDAGKFAVQDYAGDATFAQGRWTKGLATVGGTPLPSALTGTDSSAVHYLVMRDLTTFPVDGTYTCGRLKTDLRSTGLTYSGTTKDVPSNTMRVGGFAPLASVTVSGGSATLNITSITVAAGDGLWENAYQGATATFASPSDMPQYKEFYKDGGEGIAIVLGQEPSGHNLMLGIALRRGMSTGPLYKGMVSVICTP